MKSVLIIDKERSIRKALSLYLNSRGYITSEVETVTEAQSLMENTSFDTVIADVPLSDVNAVNFTER